MYLCVVVILAVTAVYTVVGKTEQYTCCFNREYESLKIPKGKAEAVSQRTDSTMVKRKRTNIAIGNTTQKTKDIVT
jgi:hypothetical protein